MQLYRSNASSVLCFNALTDEEFSNSRDTSNLNKGTPCVT